MENGIPINKHIDSTPLRSEIVQFTRRRFTIGAIGRLSPEKGFDLLIQVFTDLVVEKCDFNLIIVGEGPMRNALEEYALRRGVRNRVLFPGYIKEASRYLKFFDLFTMPSFTEGLPMVILEAMAAEIPIVATRVGGVQKVLQNGMAGQLIEPGDKKGLKKAILRVAYQCSSVKNLVEKAKTRVQQNYSSTAMAEKYNSIYRQVCAEKKISRDFNDRFM